MLTASETLDSIEERARESGNVETLVSGTCRIDLEVVQGRPYWRVNGVQDTREHAVRALNLAREQRARTWGSL
jgi:hypothetical protein